ncbi:MAG: DUF3011 domain-containing protein [Frankiaceae bacterium]|nr:DUF3011 domain-containing protein [Arenimonas sp.]
MKGFFKTGFLAGLALALGSIAGGAQAAYGYQGGYDNSGYGNSGYGNSVRDAVRCESRNGRTSYCRIDTRGGVRLVTQTSQTACIRGRTWGVSGNSVWVSRGCRGRFSSTGYGDSRYGQGDDRYNDGRYNDGRYNDGRNNDGYDNRNDDRYDNSSGSNYGSNYGRVLRCESHDGRYNVCNTFGNVGRAQLRRQLSDASCRLNVTWGYRNGGIWVDRGCRAEFIVY